MLEPVGTLDRPGARAAGAQEGALHAERERSRLYLFEHGRLPGADAGSPPARGRPSAAADRLLAGARAAGFVARWSGDPAASRRLLDEARPEIVALAPLVLAPDAAEIEMLAAHERSGPPPAVLLLLQDKGRLREVAELPLSIKDFLVAPFEPEEFVERLRLVLAQRARHLSLEERARELEGQVIRDFKTGLYTDRHFRELLRQEFHRSERHRQPLSFLLIDVDDFKAINDECEYAFGDYVLAQFARILRENIRDIDHAARFGGDEFMVLLPNTTPAEAVQVAARIRRQVSRREFENGRWRRRITLSIGIDTYDGRGASTPDELLQHANFALKEAKGRGKNRIWLFTGEEGRPAEVEERGGAL